MLGYDQILDLDDSRERLKNERSVGALAPVKQVDHESPQPSGIASVGPKDGVLGGGLRDGLDVVPRRHEGHEHLPGSLWKFEPLLVDGLGLLWLQLHALLIS